MRINITYVRNLKVGDLYAGSIKLDAPTRPVPSNAHAMEVRNISEVPAASYTLWFSDDPHSGLCSAPMLGHDLAMVIRP